MAIPRELGEDECVTLITPSGIGRLAFCMPTGPEIYPLNYTVDGPSIVFRTTPYSKLGTFAWGVDVAYEIDYQNWERRQGWSVVLKGRAERIEDPDEADRLRELGREPQPWAEGLRRMYVRIAWREITGRAVGEEWFTTSPPTDPSWFH